MQYQIWTIITVLLVGGMVSFTSLANTLTRINRVKKEIEDNEIWLKDWEKRADGFGQNK